MARVKDEDLRNIDEEDFIAQTKKYAFIKAQLEFLEKEQKTLRAQLFEVLDADGQEDDKGNIIIELPSDVDGVSSLVKQRRVSRKIDEDKAAEIIAEHGLEDTLYKTIRVVDEDALMAALYEDELTEEEVDQMYPPTVTWALVLKK
jgi:hypothetical protein